MQGHDFHLRVIGCGIALCASPLVVLAAEPWERAHDVRFAVDGTQLFVMASRSGTLQLTRAEWTGASLRLGPSERAPIDLGGAYGAPAAARLPDGGWVLAVHGVSGPSLFWVRTKESIFEMHSPAESSPLNRELPFDSGPPCSAQCIGAVRVPRGKDDDGVLVCFGEPQVFVHANKPYVASHAGYLNGPNGEFVFVAPLRDIGREQVLTDGRIVGRGRNVCVIPDGDKNYLLCTANDVRIRGGRLALYESTDPNAWKQLPAPEAQHEFFMYDAVLRKGKIEVVGVVDATPFEERDRLMRGPSDYVPPKRLLRLSYDIAKQTWSVPDVDPDAKALVGRMVLLPPEATKGELVIAIGTPLKPDDKSVPVLRIKE